MSARPVRAGIRAGVWAGVRILALAPLFAADAATAAPTVCEARWNDASRNREVPVRIRMPAGNARVPVAIFSHGLGGSLDAGTVFAEAWAAAGIAVIHVQHPGSDGELFRGRTSLADVAAALKPAASGEQLIARVRDVSFVLDEARRRPREGGCDLARLDLSRVAMAGHSFGAQTTQAIAGQRFGGQSLADPRITAAIAFSPAARGGDDGGAFGAISLPFLSLTGTADAVAIMNDVTPQDRIRPYAAMPAGDKYLVVFKDADHQIFGGWRLRRPAAPSDPHVRSATIAISTEFLRAYLIGDPGAKARLRAGTLPADALATGDRFDHK